jgi:hypothetical protein
MERIKQRLDWLKDHKYMEQVVRPCLVHATINADICDRDT